MPALYRQTVQLIRRTAQDFAKDECATMAAAVSYYTIFSLPPLLLLLLLVVGSIMDASDVRGALESQLQTLMGPTAGAQLRAIINHAERPGGGVLPTLLGSATLIFGATGAFTHLQSSLNRAWEVTPDPDRGGVRNFLLKRLFSFGMVMAIGFCLGRSNPGEAFGAAGSLAVVLLWIYYSALILLLGAEFTQAWAEERGDGTIPERGAGRLPPPEGRSAS